MISIEEAGIDRIDELAAWRIETLREVFSLPADADMTQLEAENRAYYEREIPRSGHVACFACLDGAIVGCAGMCLQTELPSPDNPSGRCAFLMNVYTRPESQHRGAGRAMIEWLVDQAIDRGVDKIYLEASAAGRRLYESVGFTDLPDFIIHGKKPEKTNR